MKQQTVSPLCERCHLLLLPGIQHGDWDDTVIYRSNKHVLLPKSSPDQLAQPCVNQEFTYYMKQQVRFGKERIWGHFLVRKVHPFED